MPIYEYQCSACGHHLEKLQKISDSALRDCPQCGKASLVKHVSAAGFKLSGTGWYETDFKTKAATTEKTPEKTSGTTESPKPAKTANETAS